MTKITIFNKLKYFTMPTFGCTIEDPEQASFGVVYQLLGIVLSICVQNLMQSSATNQIQGAVAKYKYSQSRHLDGVILNYHCIVLLCFIILFIFNCYMHYFSMVLVLLCTAPLYQSVLRRIRSCRHIITQMVR